MSFACVREFRRIFSCGRRTKFAMFAKYRFIGNFEGKKNVNCIPGRKISLTK